MIRFPKKETEIKKEIKCCKDILCHGRDYIPFTVISASINFNLQDVSSLSCIIKKSQYLLEKLRERLGPQP